jgi:hypothetical protein
MYKHYSDASAIATTCSSVRLPACLLMSARAYLRTQHARCGHEAPLVALNLGSHPEIQRTRASCSLQCAKECPLLNASHAQ